MNILDLISRLEVVYSQYGNIPVKMLIDCGVSFHDDIYRTYINDNEEGTWYVLEH